MYDGFTDDLRSALDEGESRVAEFIHETAAARGLDPWDVFEATARARLGWERGEASPARPRRRGSRRQVARQAARGLLRQLWPRRRRRGRGLLRRAGSEALRAARRQLGKASKRLARASVRAAKRQAQRAWKSARQWTRRNAAEWGRVAFGIGFWLVRRRWPSAKELTPAQPGTTRRTPPQPSPAVQALLDGYSTRESVYLFGARDPNLRDPADDWPGALKDFDKAVRNFVAELTTYAEEDTRDRHQSSRNHCPVRPGRNAPPARNGAPRRTRTPDPYNILGQRGRR